MRDSALLLEDAALGALRYPCRGEEKELSWVWGGGARKGGLTRYQDEGRLTPHLSA